VFYDVYGDGEVPEIYEGFRYLDFTVGVSITPSQAKSNQLTLVG
jgi:hypothetical protein